MWSEDLDPSNTHDTVSQYERLLTLSITLKLSVLDADIFVTPVLVASQV